MRSFADEHDDSITGALIRVRLTSVDDSGQQQLVAGQGIYGQQIGEAVRLQQYGATSVPPVGAEGLFLASGGRYDRLHMLGMEHPQYRPKGLPGGAKAIYDQSGNIIKLLCGNGAVFDFGSHTWTVTFQGGSITTTGQDFYITAANANLYLGGKKGDSFSLVQTVNGPAKNVFAAN